MLIAENLLLSYGAEPETFERGDIIFNENDTPKNYYQITSGRIKLNHYNEEGKELILAILQPGLSVCELLLFINKIPRECCCPGEKHGSETSQA